MKGARAVGVVAAVALSGGVHLAGAGYFAPDVVELDGGGDPAPARLGSSFADMVAGTPGRAEQDVVEPVEVEDAPQDPVDPPEAARVPILADAARVDVDPSEEAAPDITDVVEVEITAAPTDAQPSDAEADVAAAITPSTIAVVPVQPSRPVPVQPTVTPTPSVAQPTAAESPTDVMVAEDEVALTPLSSPRPRTRPEGLAPPPPAASGNAANNATRGSDIGTEAASATATTPTAQPAPQPGNAADIANYPGQVLRRISRAGRPRVRHTGADVVISFRIGSGGHLAGLSVARSSGNPELDQAGLSIVQRAAPFPPPPTGAQTSFSINFGGR
ncbi:energy transducer TonB family protein [Jannaschia sp. CCS1]|uniref:energy transducer TonB family protein n=1 Tax=Jannaschia sp. (strain CCS1) TaxID=290400 RepID=UPI000053CCC4|nr:energy transducer TonB [Jannaschia sp. CCS1]ABD55044.1 outer membrane transport energization protein TonB [Jannaschia sp. CCS1]